MPVASRHSSGIRLVTRPSRWSLPLQQTPFQQVIQLWFRRLPFEPQYGRAIGASRRHPCKTFATSRMDATHRQGVRWQRDTLHARHGFDIGGPFNKLAHAFTWLEIEIPDAAILDIALLDGVSFDLALELRRKNIPVIFYSSWREIFPVPDELKGVPFLEKPVHSVLVPMLLSSVIVGHSTTYGASED